MRDVNLNCIGILCHTSRFSSKFCALGWNKCTEQILSIGHHTCLHVMSLSYIGYIDHCRDSNAATLNKNDAVFYTEFTT